MKQTNRELLEAGNTRIDRIRRLTQEGQDKDKQIEALVVQSVTN